MKWTSKRYCDQKLEKGCCWRAGWDRNGETFGATEEDCFLVRFAHEECGDCGEDGEEDYGPLRPAPRFANSNESANYRSSQVSVANFNDLKRVGESTPMKVPGRDSKHIAH